MTLPGGQNTALQFWVFLIIINTQRLALLSGSLSLPFQASRRYGHSQGELFSGSDFPAGKRNVCQADYFTFPPSRQGKPPRPANSFPVRLAVPGSQPGEAELLRPPSSLWPQRSPFHWGCCPADHRPRATRALRGQKQPPHPWVLEAGKSHSACHSVVSPKFRPLR